MGRMCSSLAMGATLDAAHEAVLDAVILRDVAPYYGELERGFAATHLPAVGTIQESIGYSSPSSDGRSRMASR